MARKPIFECMRGGQLYLLDVPKAEASYTAIKPREVVDGMAVVDVSGVLVADAGWWDGWGISGYRRITSELMGAIESAEVDGILLRIDSPGGETDGAFELAEAVSAAAKKKPVWAVADVSAYSAAYLIASQAGRIIAPPESGGMGSIGVYAMHIDYSGYLKEAGIRPTFITAGEGKTDGNPYEPLSRSARERMQGEVDRLYEAFVGAVARGRGLAESKIRNEFGARTFHGGETLIEIGLADAFGTFEEALKEFRSYLTDRKAKAGPTASFAAAMAAKNTRKENSDMAALKGSQAATASASEEEVKPADQAGGAEEKKEETTDPAAPAGDTSAAGYQRGYAAAVEVVALCVLAKAPGKALGFLKAKQSPEAVRAVLLDEAAGDGSDEVAGHVVPGTAAKDEVGVRNRSGKAETKPDATLLGAMEKLGEKGGF